MGSRDRGRGGRGACLRFVEGYDFDCALNMTQGNLADESQDDERNSEIDG